MRISDWSSDVCSSDLADLDYLAATWSPPTWQARAEWTPTSLARVTFGASTGGNSRMTGMTTVPGGGREVARLLLPGAPTLSMAVKLRWWEGWRTAGGRAGRWRGGRGAGGGAPRGAW